MSALDALYAADAGRPRSNLFNGDFREAVGECGIQRSAWLDGWFVPWSPRNENQNAEGPWSHWVALAHKILEADAKAAAALAAAGPEREA